METLDTLISDPPQADSGRHRSEATAPKSPSRVSPDTSEVEVDGEEEEVESPFKHGDLVWAEAQSQSHGPLWWPAMAVYPESGAVHVRFYGDGGGGDGEEGKPRRTPAQLQRFVGEFEQMVAQRKSKRFLGAVREALRELARRLDARLLCYCRMQGYAGVACRRMRFDERDGLPVGEFLVGQFIEKLRRAAGDALGVNMLEATVLVSWANALRKSCRIEGSDGEVSVVDLREEGNLRDGTAEEERKDIVEAEGLVLGGGILRRPVVVDESNPRKQKSIAELIGCLVNEESELIAEGQKKDLDLDEKNVQVLSSHRKRQKNGDAPRVLSEEDVAVVAEVLSSQCKQKKNEEARRVSDVEDFAVVDENVVGSGRRERKRSKYLSPPFTDMSRYGKRDMSRYGKCVPLTKDEELNLSEKDSETPQAVHTMPISELRHTREILQKKGDTPKILFTDDGASIEKILNELHNSAADHLHLKRSRSAEVIRKFFKNFRSSVYVESPDFKDYQEVAEDRKSVEEKSTETELGKDKSLKVKKARKDYINGKKLNEQSNDIPSVPLPKRKYTRKEKPSTKAHSTVDPSSVNGQKEAASECVRRRNKVDAADQAAKDQQDEAVISSKESTPSHKRSRSKALENGSTVALEGHKIQHESSSLKRRKRKNSVNGETVIGSGIKHENGSEVARLNRKKNKNDGADGGEMRTLMLMFSPGCSMPSKEELLSAFSKFGAVVASRTELLMDSHSARVIFVQAADARKAVESMEGMVISGASVAKYELQLLSKKITLRSPKLAVSKTPLPYIKKSLEKMISKLVESPAPEKDGTGQLKRLRPDLAADLANEMEGMLQKVNKMLTEPSVSTVL